MLYPLPPNSIIAPAGGGQNVNNTISGDKLPFEVVRTYVVDTDIVIKTIRTTRRRLK